MRHVFKVAYRQNPTIEMRRQIFDRLPYIHSGLWLSIGYPDSWPPFLFEPPLPGLYSRYLMKLLYNTILLPSDAHSNIIKNQHCRALPVLCHVLIVLLLMISGNVPVLLLAPILTGALISASLISALVKAWVFSTFTLEAYYLKWINWKCGFTVPIQMCWSLLRHG